MRVVIMKTVLGVASEYDRTHVITCLCRDHGGNRRRR
jgi:hypothetical protein